MRCATCDYDLTGLSANCCPECGSPFDPIESRAAVYGRLVGSVLVLVAVPILATPALWFHLGGSERETLRVLVFIGLAALINSARLAVKMCDRRGGIVDWRRWVLAVPLLTVAFLAVQAAMLIGPIAACGIGGPL